MDYCYVWTHWQQKLVPSKSKQDPLHLNKGKTCVNLNTIVKVADN
jgi:hypothetical protein